jgi:hypothetical protein
MIVLLSSFAAFACSDFDDQRVLPSGLGQPSPNGDSTANLDGGGATVENCIAEGICEKSDAETLALSVKDFVNRTCVSCHGPDIAEGGIRLDSWQGIDKYAKRIVAIGLKKEDHPGVNSPSEADAEMLKIWEQIDYLIPASVVFTGVADNPKTSSEDPVKDPGANDPVKDPTTPPSSENPSQNVVDDPKGEEPPVVADPLPPTSKDPIEEPVVDPEPPVVNVEEPVKEKCICRFLKFFKRASRICS